MSRGDTQRCMDCLHLVRERAPSPHPGPNGEPWFIETPRCSLSQVKVRPHASNGCDVFELRLKNNSRRVQRFLIARDGARCAICGRTDEAFACDHVVPRSKGGSDGVSNLRLVCGRCNSSHRNEDDAVWFRNTLEKFRIEAFLATLEPAERTSRLERLLQAWKVASDDERATFERYLAEGRP